MEHTPLPWKAETHPPVFHGDKTTYSVVDSDGVIVAICGTGGDDAYFIDHAANNHYKLLEALEGLIDDVMDAGVCHTCSNFAEEDGHESDCHVPMAREAIEEVRK